MGSELLLEIGTEEIPARFIPPVMQEMADSLRKRLEQERIAVGEIVTWGTPRRLALVARDLAAGQAEAVQEIIGPPKAVAFDAAGKPTPAALGFAKAQGVAVTRSGGGGHPPGGLPGGEQERRRPAHRRAPAGDPAGVHPGLELPQVHALGSLHVTFARPIHWILALFGGQVVPFALADVTSGGADLRPPLPGAPGR